MATDTRKYAAVSQLDALDREISTIEARMKAAEARWLTATAIPDKPHKMLLVLRPEYTEADVRAQWCNWQSQLTDVLERRVELLRELNLDQEAVYGT